MLSFWSCMLLLHFGLSSKYCIYVCFSAVNSLIPFPGLDLRNLSRNGLELFPSSPALIIWSLNPYCSNLLLQWKLSPWPTLATIMFFFFFFWYQSVFGYLLYQQSFYDKSFKMFSVRSEWIWVNLRPFVVKKELSGSFCIVRILLRVFVAIIF